MTTKTATPILSAAETCAASICWLARFRMGRTIGGTEGGARIAAKVESFWHPTTCRWCQVKMEELMRLIETSMADERFVPSKTAFERLDRNTRAARVREAQAGRWYDELPK